MANLGLILLVALFSNGLGFAILELLPLKPSSEYPSGIVTMLMFANHLVWIVDREVRQYFLWEFVKVTLWVFLAIGIGVLGGAIALKFHLHPWIGHSIGTAFGLWFVMPFREKLRTRLKTQTAETAL